MSDQNKSEHETPKIIVDESWKAQVEKEKEILREHQETAGEAQDNQDTSELPPASFLALVSTLATQVMGTLGMFADPQLGKAYVDPIAAKHLIDLMAVLQEKTQGNLTDEESQMLQQALHELRLIFVEITKQLAAAGHTTETTAPSEPKKPIIELP